MGIIKTGHEARMNRWGYFFIAPFVIVFCIFNLWPTVNTFIVSFTDMSGFNNEYNFKSACDPEIKDENGNIMVCPKCKGKGEVLNAAANYGRLVNDPYFWGALKNTFIIWGINFAPQLGIALLLALWLSDLRLKPTGRNLFRAVVYMPNLFTAASVAMLFRSLFGAGGHAQAPVNQFLGLLDIRAENIVDGQVVREAFNFFRSVAFSRGIVAFIQWWMWYGHTLILLMAGITSIPNTLYESAMIDGANSRKTAWYITLPMLRPMMLYILVTSMIGGMQMFDIPFLLTDNRGAPSFSIRTAAMYQYNMAFMPPNNRSYGATVSIGIFLVTVVLALLIFFFMQERGELKNRIKSKNKKGGAA